MQRDEIREKYVSCHELENSVVFFADGISHCCDILGDNIHRKRFLYKDYPDLDSLLESFIEDKKRIIYDNMSGKRTMCSNCLRFKEGCWKKEKQITQVNFSVDNSCNLRCEYCYKVRSNNVFTYDQDILDLIKNVKSNKYINIQFPILYACGEILIQPNVNEIISELAASHDICFLSNGTKFNPKLLESISRPRNYVLISLDSGTRETYKRVKGRDLFDVVCNNIKEYSSNGGNVILKYIVMDDNTAIEDIDGFIDLCKECNINHIGITKDFDAGVTTKVKNAAMKLAYKAEKCGIHYYTDNIYEVYRKDDGLTYDYI